LALLTSSSRFNLEIAINSFNRTDGLVLSQALLSRFWPLHVSTRSRKAGMKSILAAAILLATTGMAAAADYYAPSPLVGPHSWIGPYVGANAGYQWGWVSNSPIQPSGIARGLEGGYNWQRGQFVFGAETDIELSGADATAAPFQSPVPGSGPCAAVAAWPSTTSCSLEPLASRLEASARTAPV
jgi:hypothetical protein